jgi:hypothetical protein
MRTGHGIFRRDDSGAANTSDDLGTRVGYGEAYNIANDTFRIFWQKQDHGGKNVLCYLDIKLNQTPKVNPY